MKANGAVLWRGASLIDGAPIVVIATGLAQGSSNSKTGAMVQTYILRADVSPVDAVRTGQDSAICGTCVHRGRDDGSGTGRHVGRTCYVNVGQGPRAVWAAWKRGRYANASITASPVTGEWFPDQPGTESIGVGRLVRDRVRFDDWVAPIADSDRSP